VLIEDTHKILEQVGYYLIGLHALAALVHHYVIKNNNLVPMLVSKNNISS
jgi:cytochrome b561